jgi:DNA-binding beta-propeller fold protein YncE
MSFAGTVQAAALNYDDIVASDDQTNKIWLISGTSNPVAISTGGMVSSPGHVAISNNGRIFVAEAGSSGKGILEIDPTDGTQTRVAIFASGSPTGLAIEADGSFIVTDSFLHKIFRVSTDGLTITEITTAGTNYLTGNSPWGVAIDPTSGNIIVAVTGSNSIVEVNAINGDQTLLTQGNDIDGPRDVVVSDDGTIFIANDTDTSSNPSFNGGQIVKWDGFTQTVLAMTASPGSLFSIDFEADGTVLAAGPGNVADDIQGKLVRVAQSGGATTTQPSGFFSGFKPVGVAVYIAVPEPSTGLILVGAVAGVTLRRRRV